MQEKRIHHIFVASVLFKGIHAFVEIVGGLSLYLISTATIVGTINRWSYDELIEDKNDWIANHLLAFAQSFSVAEHDFYAFYLLSLFDLFVIYLAVHEYRLLRHRLPTH